MSLALGNIFGDFANFFGAVFNGIANLVTEGINSLTPYIGYIVEGGVLLSLGVLLGKAIKAFTSGLPFVNSIFGIFKSVIP